MESPLLSYFLYLICILIFIWRRLIWHNHTRTVAVVYIDSTLNDVLKWMNNSSLQKVVLITAKPCNDCRWYRWLIYVILFALTAQYTLSWNKMTVLNRHRRIGIWDNSFHYTDITLPLKCLKISVNSIVCSTTCSTNKKEKPSKLYITGPFVRGIHRLPVDSPHKGPVMGISLPCHYLIYRSWASWRWPLACLWSTGPSTWMTTSANSPKRCIISVTHCLTHPWPWSSSEQSCLGWVSWAAVGHGRNSDCSWSS